MTVKPDAKTSMKKICGVYKITSPSGKFYIGSSVNIRSRWCGHRLDLKSDRHHCEALQRAANKYGIDALVFEVIEVCGPDEVRQREQALIDSQNPSYNSTRCVREPLTDLWKKPEFRAKVTALSREQIKRLRENDTFVKNQKESASRSLSATHKRPDFAAAHKVRATARLAALVNIPEVKARAVATRERRYKSDPVAAERRRSCGREMIAKLHANPSVMAKIKASVSLRMKAQRADPVARAKNAAGIRAAHGLPVRCIETGEVFMSMGLAATSLGLGRKNTKTIAKAARGAAPSAYGYRWSFEPKSEAA